MTAASGTAETPAADVNFTASKTSEIPAAVVTFAISWLRAYVWNSVEILLSKTSFLILAT